MNTIIRFLFMFLWLVGTVSTQELVSPAKEKYSNSIQFAITDRFTLGRFEGSIISYKRHFFSRYAIRIGFGATIKQETGTHERYTPTVDTLEAVFDRKLNYTNYELNAILLHFSPYINMLRLYFGFGPTIIKSVGS
ncbi:MAG: hypothetical protein ACE5DP_03310, partial [Fidelibacterota bacterium]